MELGAIRLRVRYRGAVRRFSVAWNRPLALTLVESDGRVTQHQVIEMTSLYANATRLTLETGNDVEAFVRVRNDGSVRPKCLLLHGNPGSLQDWQQLVPRLADVADIAAIDLPGFGKSDRPGAHPESLSLDRLAEQAMGALNTLGWREPVFFLGHSHGGGVAQTVAARCPERVAGLALLGTLGATVHASYRLLALPGAGAFARLAGRTFRSHRLRPLSRIVLQRVMTDIFSPEPVPAEKLELELALFAARPEILESMVHVALGHPCAQLLERAADIGCQTLFIHGSEDALVPASCAREIHERIVKAAGRSQFELLSGAGHMLIDYQAGEVVELIRHRLFACSS